MLVVQKAHCVGHLRPLRPPQGYVPAVREEAVSEIDNDVLSSIFASRVRLAKMDEEEAVEQCRREWRKTQKWIASSDTKDGSFLWFCLEFDLDAGAVRKAIKEKVK